MILREKIESRFSVLANFIYIIWKDAGLAWPSVTYYHFSQEEEEKRAGKPVPEILIDYGEDHKMYIAVELLDDNVPINLCVCVWLSALCRIHANEYKSNYYTVAEIINHRYNARFGYVVKDDFSDTHWHNTFGGTDAASVATWADIVGVVEGTRAH